MHNKNLSKIDALLKILQYLLLGSAAAQPFIYFSPENITATILCATSSTLVLQYLIRSKCYETHPISSLALFGMTITTVLMSTVSQSFYLNPLTIYMRAPELTFPILATTQALACLLHWIYRNFSPLNALPNYIARFVLEPIGAFYKPPVWVLWIFGCIGLYAQLSGVSEFGDAGGKFIQALGFLTWMPLLIVYYLQIEGDNYANKKNQTKLLIGYLLVLVVLGIAQNVRSIMFIGPLQIVLTYYFLAAKTHTPATPKTSRNIAAMLVVGMLGVIALADLATAMVLAREKRVSSTPLEMLEETYYALQDRTKINAYRANFDMAATSNIYDEAYIPNPILSRFSATKFHDNMIFFGSKMQSENVEDMFHILFKKIIVVLPEPVAKAIDPKFEKQDYFFSMGDYYVFQIKGPGSLSSFVVGSIWADMYTLFGIWWPFTALISIFISIIALDSFCIKKKENAYDISPVAICLACSIFLQGMGFESITAQISFLGRELPQRVIFYGALIFIIVTSLKLLGTKKND